MESQTSLHQDVDASLVSHLFDDDAAGGAVCSSSAVDASDTVFEGTALDSGGCSFSSVNVCGTDFSSTAASSPHSEALPSSVSSSSSSSSTEQSEASVASTSSLLPVSNFEVPSSLSSSLQSLDVANAVISFSTAPIIQKRGPGRPRKDGSIPIQRKRPPCPFLRTTGRPRGRRRHYAGERVHLQLQHFSGIPMQTCDGPKIGEPAVALVPPQLSDVQEKNDLFDLALDSDNSLSSAVSYERSASDETILDNWASKICSFCNLGEKSLLGQGEMTKVDPSVGFNPFRKSPKARRGSCESERDSQLDKSPKVMTWRRQKGRSRERSKSPRRSDDDSNSQPVDELSIVGFSEEPDVNMLFESTGHTYAHHCCAAWSDGVCQTEDYVLVNVDRAVVAGMMQKCSNCRRYGATILCRGPKCNKVYHYPCAASSGAFQDIKTMSLLCSQHHHLAPSIAETEANCIVCDTPGDISELLFCTSCGHHYHGHCLDPNVAVNPVVRAGWQCPECKICQTCRQPGDDNKMLVCDTCDKGYHTYCLKPVMTSIPKNGWKCKNCRVCGDCGSRTPGSGISSRWHMNYSVCDSCYQQRNKGLACPLCGRAYRHFAQKEMVQCVVCKKFVHEKCDPDIDLLAIQQQRDADLPPEYICPPCVSSGGKSGPRYVRPKTPDSKEPAWLSPASKGKEECSILESSPLVGSQESFLTLNDDSVCSMDIDLQAIERSAQQLQQLSCSSSFSLFEDLSPTAGKTIFPSVGKPFSSFGKIAGKKKIGIGRPRGGAKFVSMKRRVRVAEYGKRRGPKPKLKRLLGSCGPVFQMSQMDSIQGKLDEEPGLENKIVLCSAKDEFVLSQDMCIMCGSYGKGEEGRLVSCSQCGQCYHPYCVSIKITKVLLNKGWRCLDCTVCEGCGQPHDESRLLLCDECDISYHIYCLDPPLEQVPQGNWKCKWCVICLECDSTTPGHNAQWQNNYTRCGPCSSKSVCPVCIAAYKDDELIIQCEECDRWLHASCDQITSEEDAERCADSEYHCILCRPADEPPPHLCPPPPPSPKVVELSPKPSTPIPLKSSPEPSPLKSKSQAQPQFFVDGVYLSEMGMDQIKSLTLEQPKKTRARKPKQLPTPVKLPNLDSVFGDDLEDKPINDVSLEHSGDGEKLELGDDDLPKESHLPEDVPVEKKKRQRNLQKLGVGGFAAKPRGRFVKDLEKGELVYGQSESRIKEDYSSFVGSTDGGSLSLIPDKPKRRRKVKRKSILEDTFPAYLQEAFFGKSLLDNTKECDTKLDAISDEEKESSSLHPITSEKSAVASTTSTAATTTATTTVGSCTVGVAAEAGSLSVQQSVDTSEKSRSSPKGVEDLNDSEALKDILPLPHDLPQDEDLVTMLMTEGDELTKSEDDIARNALSGEDVCQEVDCNSAKDDSLNKDDPLNDILSPHFNFETMVSDSGLPQMDGKEVEDLFKGVLTGDVAESSSSLSELPNSPTPGSSLQATSVAAGIPAAVQRVSAPIPPSLPLSSPFSVPPPSPYPSEYSSSPQFSPGFSEPPPSPWLPPEPEIESPSYNQRSVLKWEGDETLGPCATISAVLYANLNHPELKNEFPIWADRAKQIAKIWRSLPSEKRTQYVQKARENRAASRMQKAQQMKDSGNSVSTTTSVPKQSKRSKQGSTSPVPVLAPVLDSEVVSSPISPRRPPVHEKEQERIIREQKSHREQEQERQWKQLQAIRQQQAQQQQQILQEQRAQVVPSHTHPLPTLPAMVRVHQQISAVPMGQPSSETNLSTPPSPVCPYPCMPSAANTQLPADQFPQHSSHSPHSNLIQESVGQVRSLVSGQLLVHTSQGKPGDLVLSPHQSQAAPPSRMTMPFTPPIQVSRVRAPIDAVQMQPIARMQDPYAQMPGTPRPMPCNSSQDVFIRPQHRLVNPQMCRQPLRFQEPYSRPLYTPRPPPPSPEIYLGQSPSANLSKPPHISGDLYSKQPGTPRPLSRDSLGSSTPRPSELFTTPPSTPHPQTPTPDSVVQPRTPVSSEAFSPTLAPPRPAPSPFSPTQTHVMAEVSAKSPVAPLPSQAQQDMYPSVPRVFHPQDNFQQTGALQRPPQDPYAQPPPSPFVSQEAFVSPVGNPRQRPKLENFGSRCVSPHSLSSPVNETGGIICHSPQQQPQGLETYVQPHTPVNPCPSSSPLDEFAERLPNNSRTNSQNVVPQLASGRTADQFHLANRHEATVDASASEHLIRARGVLPAGSGMDAERSQIMARQQLRDLLQKQQMKKQIEQLLRDQGRIPLRHWPLEQKPDNVDTGQQSPHSPGCSQDVIRAGLAPGAKCFGNIPRQATMGGPRSLTGDSGFRQPYPPNMRPRIGMPPGGGVPPGIHQVMQQPLHGHPQALMGQFRHPGQVLDPLLQDPQVRMSLIQHRMMQAGGQMRMAGLRPGNNLQAMQGVGGNNPMDPYDHLVQQHQQSAGSSASVPSLCQPQVGFQQRHTLVGQQCSFSQSPSGGPGSKTLCPNEGMRQSSMIHNKPSAPNTLEQSAHHEQMMPNSSLRHALSQQQNPQVIDRQIGVDRHNYSEMQKHNMQQSVTTSSNVAQEQQRKGTALSEAPLDGGRVNDDGNAAEDDFGKMDKDLHEPKPCEPDDDLDDDELLGLGNDFNILEYADPELDHDIVGDGKKTNILDENLDLDDKDEDLDDEEEKSKIDSLGKEADIKTEAVENTAVEQSTENASSSANQNDKQQASNSGTLGPTDFQAKFLEFSQRRDLEKAEELKNFENEGLESGVRIKMEKNVPKLGGEVSQSLNVVPSASSSISLHTMQMMSPSPSTSFSVQDASQVKTQPIVTPLRPMGVAQFGQPSVSLPHQLRQQIPLSPNASRMANPPPYPNPGVRPPPPYQAVQGVVHGPVPPRHFPGKPVMVIPGHSGSGMGQRPHIFASQASKPVNIPEQRLLLEDLLEQEKLEQRRQQQQQGILGQSHNDDSLLSDIDFEKLKADVLGTAGPPVSMSPPVPAVPAQGMLPLQSPNSLTVRASSPVRAANPVMPMSLGHPESTQVLGYQARMGHPPQPGLGQVMLGGPRPVTSQDAGMHPALLQPARLPFPITSLPPPPTPPAEPVTEADRQQQHHYEHWLYQQQRVLAGQQKYFEAEVGKLRKVRKSLNTKQRNLRKNAQQLTETDARELERITREQTGLQKQLEQVRKQGRQHSMLVQEYHMKQQKRQQHQMLTNSQQMMQQPSPNVVPSPSPMMSAPGTPISPLMSPSHMGPSPSPLGPSPSPLRQQSPSPMMQHSPLASAQSPMMQHSPHGQSIYQQTSPRMTASAVDQQVLRSSNLQVSQEDNNPFSDGFQHRELHNQQQRHFPHHQLMSGKHRSQEESDDDKSNIQQHASYYAEEGLPMSHARQNWTRLPCGNRTPEQGLKTAPRGCMPIVGQRFHDPLNVDLHHSYSAKLSMLDQSCPQPTGSLPLHPNPPVQHMGQSPSPYSQPSPSSSHTEIGRRTPLSIKMQTPSPSASSCHADVAPSPSVISPHVEQEPLSYGLTSHNLPGSVPSSPRSGGISYQESSVGSLPYNVCNPSACSSSPVGQGFCRQLSCGHMNMRDDDTVVETSLPSSGVLQQKLFTDTGREKLMASGAGRCDVSTIGNFQSEVNASNANARNRENNSLSFPHSSNRRFGTLQQNCPSSIKSHQFEGQRAPTNRTFAVDSFHYGERLQEHSRNLDSEVLFRRTSETVGTDPDKQPFNSNLVTDSCSATVKSIDNDQGQGCQKDSKTSASEEENEKTRVANMHSTLVNNQISGISGVDNTLKHVGKPMSALLINESNSPENDNAERHINGDNLGTTNICSNAERRLGGNDPSLKGISSLSVQSTCETNKNNQSYAVQSHEELLSENPNQNCTITERNAIDDIQYNFGQSRVRNNSSTNVNFGNYGGGINQTCGDLHSEEKAFKQQCQIGSFRYNTFGHSNNIANAYGTDNSNSKGTMHSRSLCNIGPNSDGNSAMRTNVSLQSLQDMFNQKAYHDGNIKTVESRNFEQSVSEENLKKTGHLVGTEDIHNSELRTIGKHSNHGINNNHGSAYGFVETDVRSHHVSGNNLNEAVCHNSNANNCTVDHITTGNSGIRPDLHVSSEEKLNTEKPNRANAYSDDQNIRNDPFNQNKFKDHNVTTRTVGDSYCGGNESSNCEPGNDSTGKDLNLKIKTQCTYRSCAGENHPGCTTTSGNNYNLIDFNGRQNESSFRNLSREHHCIPRNSNSGNQPNPDNLNKGNQQEICNDGEKINFGIANEENDTNIAGFQVNSGNLNNESHFNKRSQHDLGNSVEGNFHIFRNVVNRRHHNSSNNTEENRYSQGHNNMGTNHSNPGNVNNGRTLYNANSTENHHSRNSAMGNYHNHGNLNERNQDSQDSIKQNIYHNLGMSANSGSHFNSGNCSSGNAQQIHDEFNNEGPDQNHGNLSNKGNRDLENSNNDGNHNLGNPHNDDNYNSGNSNNEGNYYDHRNPINRGSQHNLGNPNGGSYHNLRNPNGESHHNSGNPNVGNHPNLGNPNGGNHHHSGNPNGGIHHNPGNPNGGNHHNLGNPNGGNHHNPGNSNTGENQQNSINHNNGGNHHNPGNSNGGNHHNPGNPNGGNHCNPGNPDGGNHHNPGNPNGGNHHNPGNPNGRNHHNLGNPNGGNEHNSGNPNGGNEHNPGNLNGGNEHNPENPTNGSGHHSPGNPNNGSNHHNPGNPNGSNHHNPGNPNNGSNHHNSGNPNNESNHHISGNSNNGGNHHNSRNLDDRNYFNHGNSGGNQNLGIYNNGGVHQNSGNHNSGNNNNNGNDILVNTSNIGHLENAHSGGNPIHSGNDENRNNSNNGGMRNLGSHSNERNDFNSGNSNNNRIHNPETSNNGGNNNSGSPSNNEENHENSGSEENHRISEISDIEGNRYHGNPNNERSHLNFRLSSNGGNLTSGNPNKEETHLNAGDTNNADNHPENNNEENVNLAGPNSESSSQNVESCGSIYHSSIGNDSENLQRPLHDNTNSSNAPDSQKKEENQHCAESPGSSYLVLGGTNTESSVASIAKTDNIDRQNPNINENSSHPRSDADRRIHLIQEKSGNERILHHIESDSNVGEHYNAYNQDSGHFLGFNKDDASCLSNSGSDKFVYDDSRNLYDQEMSHAGSSLDSLGSNLDTMNKFGENLESGAASVSFETCDFAERRFSKNQQSTSDSYSSGSMDNNSGTTTPGHFETNKSMYTTRSSFTDDFNTLGNNPCPSNRQNTSGYAVYGENSKVNIPSASGAPTTFNPSCSSTSDNSGELAKISQDNELRKPNVSTYSGDSHPFRLRQDVCQQPGSVNNLSRACVRGTAMSQQDFGSGDNFEISKNPCVATSNSRGEAMQRFNEDVFFEDLDHKMKRDFIGCVGNPVISESSLSNANTFRNVVHGEESKGVGMNHEIQIQTRNPNNTTIVYSRQQQQHHSEYVKYETNQFQTGDNSAFNQISSEINRGSASRTSVDDSAHLNKERSVINKVHQQMSPINPNVGEKGCYSGISKQDPENINENPHQQNVLRNPNIPERESDNHQHYPRDRFAFSNMGHSFHSSNSGTVCDSSVIRCGSANIARKPVYRPSFSQRNPGTGCDRDSYEPSVSSANPVNANYLNPQFNKSQHQSGHFSTNNLCNQSTQSLCSQYIGHPISSPNAIGVDDSHYDNIQNRVNFGRSEAVEINPVSFQFGRPSQNLNLNDDQCLTLGEHDPESRINSNYQVQSNPSSSTSQITKLNPGVSGNEVHTSVETCNENTAGSVGGNFGATGSHGSIDNISSRVGVTVASSNYRRMIGMQQQMKVISSCTMPTSLDTRMKSPVPPQYIKSTNMVQCSVTHGITPIRGTALEGPNVMRTSSSGGLPNVSLSSVQQSSPGNMQFASQEHQRPLSGHNLQMLPNEPFAQQFSDNKSAAESSNRQCQISSHIPSSVAALSQLPQNVIPGIVCSVQHPQGPLVNVRPGGISQSKSPLTFVQHAGYPASCAVTSVLSSPVSQPRAGAYIAVNSAVNYAPSLHQTNPRGVSFPVVNPRMVRQDQIGQPQLQMPQNFVALGNRPVSGIQYVTSANVPVGTFPVQTPQSAMIRCAEISAGVPKVSQVGLPLPSTSPHSVAAVAYCGQMPPTTVISPTTVVASTSVSQRNFVLNANVAPSTCVHVSSTTATASKVEEKFGEVDVKKEAMVVVKVESSASSHSCQLAVKQEIKVDTEEHCLGEKICPNVTQRSVMVTKTDDLPLVSCAVTKAEMISKIASVKCQLMSQVQQNYKKADGESKEDKVESHEGIPQNALLKQLLQNSQPQPSPQLTRKSTEDNVSDVGQSSGVHEHRHKSECADRIPIQCPPVLHSAVVMQNAPVEENAIISHTVEMQQRRESFSEDLPKSNAKRKQTGQQKRQPKPAKVKDGTPAKKRPRKGSTAKTEEDFDSFVDATMVLLRALPRLSILEPDIKPNFNVCPVFGTGDLNPGDCKLKGAFGRTVISIQPDYYSVRPFGNKSPVPIQAVPLISANQRGFYNQEFPPQCLTEHLSEACSESGRSMSVLASHPSNADKSKRDLETPDTVIMSSSPECSVVDPIHRFLGLRLIDDDDSKDSDLKSASPVIPLFAPIPIRIGPFLDDKKKNLNASFDDEDADVKDKENVAVGGHQRFDKESLLLKSKLGFGPSAPLKDSGNVAVTLTLTSAAAEDIRGVLTALSNILNVSVPISYDITERTVTPPSQKLGLYKKGKDNIQSILNGPPRFCRHCDVLVLNSGIKKKLADLPFVTKEDQDEDEIIFCSTNCYMQFAVINRSVGNETEKGAAAVVTHVCDIFGPLGGKLDSVETLSSSTAKPSEKRDTSILEHVQDGKSASCASDKAVHIDEKAKVDDDVSKSPSSIKSEHSTLSPRETVAQTNLLMSSASIVSNTKNRRSMDNDDDAEEPMVKKWKGVKWKRYDELTRSPARFKPSEEDEINQTLDNLSICLKPKKSAKDSRVCALCSDVGDGDTNGPARLLNLDVDRWIHLNCALWSAEVYETVNGALMNVDLALKRGMMLDCVTCRRKGATLGCFRFRCTNIYHFTCAFKEKCMFFKDKTMLCPAHIPKQSTPELKENELPSLTVFRRVYVNRDENRQVANVMHRGDQNFLLRVGNLIFLSIGQLLPHQLQAFHTAACIYPVGYKIIRMYWSMRQLGKRCQYVCSICDNDGKPGFQILVKEGGFPDIVCKDVSPKGVWQQVLEPIERLRREAKVIKVFSAFITGEDLYGLNEPSVLRIIESLPGIETLSDYNFKYGRSPLLELPLAINPTGCARAEPKLRTHFKRPHTLHTCSSSRSSFQTTITGLESACPYTKQFVHSKSSQYRKMKVEWRNNVYLARSRIQGLGLYAAREIEKHTMVIEYIGQLIRNEVAENRERMYEAQNRGIYMFRLDDGRVIDASVSGGLARYINHSCNPNCVAEVVQIDRDNRIIIFANRRISRGEELAYDYKFDIEDDQHKIPCLCGAANCRKWMN